ncbi:MAG: DUF5668 domain-containing protein [Candidatus Marinimicrobia bacterium]|nr:DUF5668 domain-containing protein [Candidatus Neomarinimicrobiota bacterium]
MKKHLNYNRTIIAIVFVAVGLLLLARNFDLVNFNINLSTWWPAILIFVGLSKLVSDRMNRGFAIFLIILGSIFLLRNLNYFENLSWNLSDIFWPVIFVFIGLSILFKGSFHQIDKHRNSVTDKSKVFDYFTIFGGSNNKVHSTDLQSGKALAIFGGVDIDLLSAKINDNKLAVSLTVIFGGIDLKIPSNWNVIQKGMPIFGAFDDKRKTADNLIENAPTVYLYTFIAFGGVTIKN